MAVQIFANGGAIIVFGGGPGSPPDPFLNIPPASVDDQPALDKLQKFPQAFGLKVVVTGPLLPEMGVEL